MRSPLEPSQNDVWVTSAEIPYWWRVTAQILVVLLIGWKKIPTNQKHYQGLDSERHRFETALVTQTSFCEGSSGDLVKHWLFSQATVSSLLMTKSDIDVTPTDKSEQAIQTLFLPGWFLLNQMFSLKFEKLSESNGKTFSMRVRSLVFRSKFCTLRW